MCGYCLYHVLYVSHTQYLDLKGSCIGCIGQLPTTFTFNVLAHISIANSIWHIVVHRSTTTDLAVDHLQIRTAILHISQHNRLDLISYAMFCIQITTKLWMCLQNFWNVTNIWYGMLFSWLELGLEFSSMVWAVLVWVFSGRMLKIWISNSSHDEL